MKEMDWNEIQDFYNKNHFWSDVLKEFKISSSALSKAIKNGYFKTRGRKKSSELLSKLRPK